MEARGKAHPPGPELRRGRPDLSEIIQQATNPYVDKRSLGDTWCAARECADQLWRVLSAGSEHQCADQTWNWLPDCV
jgi:hypothetical protein